MLYEVITRQARALARRLGLQVAVLFLDLDRFKTVNDTLGHSVGDQMLQEVARRVVGGVRESDTVARLGGDEFTVLLGNLEKPEDAEIRITSYNVCYTKLLR